MISGKYSYSTLEPSYFSSQLVSGPMLPLSNWSFCLPLLLLQCFEHPDYSQNPGTCFQIRKLCAQVPWCMQRLLPQLNTLYISQAERWAPMIRPALYCTT